MKEKQAKCNNQINKGTKER